MDTLLHVSTIASNISIVLAMLVGGVWAFYRFHHAGEGDAKPQLQFSYDVHPYSATSSLLVMTVRVINAGSSEMRPRSIKLSVRQLPTDTPINTALHWNDGKDMRTIDVMKDANPQMEDGDEYVLLPHDAYDEVVMLTVPNQCLCMASMRYQGTDDTDFIIYKVMRVDRQLA